VTINYRGLNVFEPESTTPEELEAFFAFPDQPTGRPLESYALWAELRPDVLKRLLAWVYQIHESESFSCPLPYLNIYAVGGWSEGVKYIMKICQPSTFLSVGGYTKDAIIETLALSFYLSPSWGTVQTAQAAQETLVDFREPAPGAATPYPDGWSVDPAALKAGLDYSTPDLSKADLDALFGWYERTLGEIPKGAQQYAKYRPNLLKAERNRWENIVQTGLPNQMFAFLLIHHETWRGRASGVRESLLLARGLGMAKNHAVDALFYGGSFLGGMTTVTEVSDAAEEVLESW
jgi:hypothetical protein